MFPFRACTRIASLTFNYAADTSPFTFFEAVHTGLMTPDPSGMNDKQWQQAIHESWLLFESFNLERALSSIDQVKYLCFAWYRDGQPVYDIPSLLHSLDIPLLHCWCFYQEEGADPACEPCLLCPDFLESQSWERWLGCLQGLHQEAIIRGHQGRHQLLRRYDDTYIEDAMIAPPLAMSVADFQERIG